jgi:hypothetical protein
MHTIKFDLPFSSYNISGNICTGFHPKAASNSGRIWRLVLWCIVYGGSDKSMAHRSSVAKASFIRYIDAIEFTTSMPFIARTAPFD